MFVRKSAHFTLYFILGLLVISFLKEFGLSGSVADSLSTSANRFLREEATEIVKQGYNINKHTEKEFTKLIEKEDKNLKIQIKLLII